MIWLVEMMERGWVVKKVDERVEMKVGYLVVRLVHVMAVK